jgi:hypothetical protein
MKTAAQALEDNLTCFMSALDPHLTDPEHVPSSILNLFTETALSLFVLEYALRKKGLLEWEEVSQALRDAEETVKRIQAHRGVMPVGRA